MKGVKTKMKKYIDYILEQAEKGSDKYGMV